MNYNIHYSTVCIANAKIWFHGKFEMSILHAELLNITQCFQLGFFSKNINTLRKCPVSQESNDKCFLFIDLINKYK